MLGELTADQIERLLHEQVVGRIGCHAHGSTYIVPITYAYDGANVVGHSAEGRKIQMMRDNPNVCFEVDALTDMANWQSVIAWGAFQELSGEEAKAAIRFLVSRLTPLTVSETSVPTHGLDMHPAHHDEAGGKTPVVYRIRLYQKSGRYEKR